MNSRPITSAKRCSVDSIPEAEEVFSRESLLYERVDNKVRCNVCERRCLLPPGGFGWSNPMASGWKVLTLIYGALFFGGC